LPGSLRLSLVRAHQAEEQDHRILRAVELDRQQLLVGKPGQIIEGTVGYHPDPFRRQPDQLLKPAGTVLGMGDDRIHRVEGALGGRQLPPLRLR